VGESVGNAPEAGPPLVHDVVLEMRARLDELEHRIYVLEAKQKGAADE
jgi:BMFP domain-containing protein YqiC